nr:MobA/MobL family protein [Bifidobacterium subtile]
MPSHAPPSFSDRETLWNEVEKAERGKEAQLAYSFDIALQNEFSMQENRVRTFSWRLNERIIICPVPRNDSARWICTPPRR